VHPAVGAHRVPLHHDVDATPAGFVNGQPRASDIRVAVYAPRDPGVVDRFVWFTVDALYGEDALGEPNVCKLWSVSRSVPVPVKTVICR
jgi:hypothetical protein